MQRDSRLKRELHKFSADPPKGISVCRKDDASYMLEASMVGPEDSPYRNGIFHLQVRIPERYPFAPPGIRFLTKVYHPNIDDQGRICLDLLKMAPRGSWKPTYTIEGLLIAIQMLLANPNPQDFLMIDIAQEMMYTPEEFRRNAELYTEKHATA